MKRKVPENHCIFFNIISNRTYVVGTVSERSKEEGKELESIQTSTTPRTPHRTVTKQTRKHHIQESQEVSPFPADDHETALDRQDSMTDTKHK